MEKALNLLNDLDTDFKATTKVAELLEYGDFKAEDVVILPIGAKKSAYLKDVNGYSSFYAESMLKDCLTIEVNREGLYDMLPEGLFHDTPTRSSGLTAREMMADMQLRRTEEKDARKFFMPFEAELNYMRTLLDWYENRLDKKTVYDDFSRIFSTQWTEFKSLNKDQRIIWMHVLPVIRQKRNNNRFLGELLSVLFNIPVHVHLIPSAVFQTPIPEEIQYKVGASGALGTDTVIGSSFMSEQEEISINIGPADSNKLIAFLPGTSNAHLLNIVTAYLIPVETRIKVELFSSQENRMGALGAHSANSFLGFTVYL